ncbi:hypothetical protein ACFXDE_11985 [Kitasatospora sp. NPDC059408]|uniref:hypothetical protein n=1 Tax=Kitasatospora sp. NPDC059408 TaxID=3346823 RepID=UPI0036BC8347
MVLTGAVLALGHPGWLLLGLFFAAVGAAGPPVAAWTERTRPGEPGDGVPDPVDLGPVDQEPIDQEPRSRAEARDVA